MSKNNVYLDTNIIISVFLKEIDHQKYKKNIEIYNDAIKENQKIKISNIILAETYHVLFKKFSKKYCTKKGIKVQNLNVLLKNDDVIGFVNSIAILLFQTMEENVQFEMDYIDMTESILKYKISANDYLFNDGVDGKILTGDEDLRNFIDSRI
jgi:predicted nucleic acid-binding protein